MPKKRKSYEDLAAEILGYWKKFEGDDEQEKIGRALQDLLDIADKLCKERNWQQAQECCEMGLELLCAIWNPGYRMDRRFAEAVAQLYLGAVYVGQAKLDTAADYYQASTVNFSATGINLYESIAWLSLGKVRRVGENWVKSLWAYQRGLNIILGQEFTSCRSAKVDQLQELVEQEIQGVNSEIEENLRGAPRVVTMPFDRQREARKAMETVVIPVVSQIAAGEPMWTGEAIMAHILDESNIIDEISLDEEHAKEASFALEVKGESMIDAGINNGDYVFIRAQRVADSGEIAAVMVMHSADEAETTLKKFYREENHVRLQPMNSREKPLIVVPLQEDRDSIETYYKGKGIKVEIIQDADMAIVGKVVAVWRAVAS